MGTYIPKKIHYIWLGHNKLPKLVKKCIKSWKKYCPDYEIILWNEDNINFDVNEYYTQSYAQKRYAFAADALRFKILKEYGGIYLDVDVELISTLDKFLANKFFIGFESEKFIAPGLIVGCEPNNEIVSEIDKYYNSNDFKNLGDKTITVCNIVTDVMKNYGVTINNETQEFKKGMVVYSSDYFCPKSLMTGKIKKTKNTVSIHHYLATWVKPSTKIKNKILQTIKRIVGEKTVEKIKKRRESR